MERRDQIKKLLSRKRAALIRDKWLADLVSATGVSGSDIRFIDVQATSKLKEAFIEKLKSGDAGLHRYWPKSNFAELVQFLSPLAASNLKIVLFSSVDADIGAVELTIKPVVMNISAVWRVVEQDLCIAANDVQDGLCLEENYYDLLGNYLREGLYELTAWGILQPKATTPDAGA